MKNFFIVVFWKTLEVLQENAMKNKEFYLNLILVVPPIQNSLFPLSFPQENNFHIKLFLVSFLISEIFA